MIMRRKFKCQCGYEFYEFANIGEKKPCPQCQKPCSSIMYVTHANSTGKISNANLEPDYVIGKKAEQAHQQHEKRTHVRNTEKEYRDNKINSKPGIIEHGEFDYVPETDI